MVNHNNGMRGLDTVVLPCYQTDDNLYAIISFSLSESGYQSCLTESGRESILYIMIPFSFLKKLRMLCY